MKKKVILPWPTEKGLVEVIREAEIQLNSLRDIANVNTSPVPSEEEWFKLSGDAYVVSSPRIGLQRYREFLENAKELRMIQTFSIGYDNIDIQACTANNIIVCNIGEVMAESVAQHTWALILAVSKHVGRSDRVMRDGGWLRENRFGVEVYGKTLGIIGLGDIGGRVALKGKLAFGMKVLAYDPYLLQSRAQLYGAELVSLERLLQESDVISVNCPLNGQTYHLLGEKQFRLLKTSTILVNTARGKIIDEVALLSALEQRVFFGAGLDVFEEEPLSPRSNLCKLDNIILTSHIASSTKEAFNSTWQNGIANITKFIKGEKPHWIVNPAALKCR
ncbi:MAG: hypothetical protein QG670_1197 [Thermoproteota archaeon]|nr:hypothetical protein [Thermoproteota archaeon]